MSKNKSAPIAFAMLSLLLLTAPAHASTATVPKPIGGVKPFNPSMLALELATSAILEGIGWIMDDGVKIDKKVPDQPAEDSPEATAGISNGTAVGTQTAPNSVYPMEYYIGGQAFTTIENAKEYIIGPYLKERGLKRTRGRDGLYFDDVKVYFGNYANSQSSIGKFVVSVQAGSQGTNYPNNVGGSIYSYQGSIFYRGTESTMTTEVSESYIKAREEAKKAVEQAIANALPVPVPDDQPLPDETQPDTKPTPAPVPVPDDLPTVAPNDPAKPETKPTPAPVPVPDDLPTVAPNDPAKPETKPETQPDTKPKPVPVPVPIPAPAPEVVPQPQPQPSPSPETQPKPVPVPSPNPSNNPSPTMPPDVAPIGREPEDAKPFELPAFCDWASKVCDFIDWTKEAPEKQEIETPTKNIELKNPSEFDKDYVSVNSQCPADVVKQFSTGFASNEIRFEFKPICDFASDYLKYVIVFIAYIIAIVHIGSAFKVG